MSTKKPVTVPTRRVTRPKTSAPKTARRRALAEEAAAEIAGVAPPVAAIAAAEALVEPAGEPIAEIVAPPPAAPEPMPSVLVIEPRVSATEDEPTTRVVFRARPPMMARPNGWLLVRVLLGRLRSEVATRSAPVRARFVRRFPRLAGIGRLLARFA